MHDDSFFDSFAPRRRGRVLAVLSVAALALHAAAVNGLQWTWPAPDTTPLAMAMAAPMQLRIVDDAPLARLVAPDPAARPVSAATTTPAAPAAPVSSLAAPLPQLPKQPAVAATALRLAPVPVEPLESTPAVALDRPVPSAAPRATPQVASQLTPRAAPRVSPQVELKAPPEVALKTTAPKADTALALNTAGNTTEGATESTTESTADVPPAAPESGASAGDTGAPPLPHYRTHVPPAITLQYELQRGLLRGSGELVWRPDHDRYELKLTGRVGAIAALTQISSGGFDAAGVAPLRFTDQRLSRAPMAANFQREAGKVTFSGPSTEYALVPGTQDRLSWMIQLAAIVAAEPGVRVPGAAVSMFVVGSRGEASVWSFHCVGPESVDTPGGSVASVKFVREPHDEHDNRVQVWLDPGRHWLPVRAHQQSGSGDEAFELRLQSATPSP